MIRSATLDDASAMARVLVDTYSVAHRGQIPDRLLDSPPIDEAYATSERNWLRTLRKIDATPQSKERVFVAIVDARIVGLGMGCRRTLSAPQFAEYRGEVVSLYVLPSHQRRGIGRTLLRAICQHLVDVGLSTVAIECLNANEPARRFYEAMEGKIVGERLIEDDGSLLPTTVYGWTAAAVSRLLGKN